mmetsp:Transcript_669/g.718  ORF Transcript_669/g.718 Transcript_669/m.718 type:complete len:117 (-) Transcript_669:804-1154(-)
MEKEKLEEAKKTFEEDQDKFKKFMSELNERTEKSSNDVKELMTEKANRIKDIVVIEQEIAQNKSDVKKIEESLIMYKQHKKFLDIVAISAGRKQPQNILKSSEPTSSLAISPDKSK